MHTLFCTKCGTLAKDHSHVCGEAPTVDLPKDPTFSWLAWRMGGIGSSDAPIIMNASPWLTPYKLWEIKTGKAVPEKANMAMLRGRNLEALARKSYEAMTGVSMLPGLAMHPKFKFVRASLDGMNKSAERVIEIKCPGKKDHEEAKAGRIPRKYIWQCVHLLLTTGLPVLHYFSFDGKEGVIVPYRRDKKKEKELLTEITKFWDCVQNNTPPTSQEKSQAQIFKLRKC